MARRPWPGLRGRGTRRRVPIRIESAGDVVFLAAMVVLAAALLLWRQPAFRETLPWSSRPSVVVPETASSTREGWVRVARVVDGDTLKLEGGERVRLIGVDTPETVRPNTPVQFFGPEASAFTKSLCEGQSVRLEYDWQRQDDYHRTLAYVYLPDGRMVNAELIKGGYGRAYTRFPFKYSDLFREYQRDARQAGRGLWARHADAVHQE